VRENPVPGVCQCVLIDCLDPGRRRVACEYPTTGPDDPFCPTCTGRHVGDPVVDAGDVEVTTRPLGQQVR
jgi:hypothetical protein